MTPSYNIKSYLLHLPYHKVLFLSIFYRKIIFLGTSDFYSLNHYTTNFIRPAKPGEDAGIWDITGSPELNAVLYAPPGKEHFGPFPLLVVNNLSYFK